MDAKITKQRLANLLSYDWIKILVAVAFAVLGLVAFFTTVSPRAGREHTFTVYGYVGIFSGSAANSLEEDLKKGALSYDILLTEVESFGDDEYSGQAYTARRSSGAGNVMFLNASPDEEGESDLSRAAGGDMSDIALNVEIYFGDCEKTLVRFFGEEWEKDECNREEAQACFLARNGKDNRYRFSAEKREEGVLDEIKRLEKLREDYLFVQEKFADGTLKILSVKDEEGKDRPQAIGVGGLKGLSRLFYYWEEEAKSSSDMAMIFFRNDSDAGKPAEEVENDLRFEGISFLKYLVEKFGV